jgi:predicted acetyltransferase
LLNNDQLRDGEKENETTLMKNAPKELIGDIVKLRFDAIKPGDVEKGYVPFYNFRIIDKSGNDVGHIIFKVGNTDHILYCSGHIGYGIKEIFRGNSYAYYACIAIAPFVRSVYSNVLITCNLDNIASIKTIEKLNCQYLDEITLNENEQAYKNGERTKRRYRWIP